MREISAAHDIGNIDDKTINSYLASYISSRFGVSPGALEIALNESSDNGNK